MKTNTSVTKSESGRSLSERLARHIETHFSRMEKAPVVCDVRPETIRNELSRYDFSNPLPLSEVFDDVTDMLWKWTEHANNPMHFGLFRPAISEASVVADALVALYDPNLATWDFSPAANEIERHLLDFVAAQFEIDMTHGLAQFTSGGQEANHTAVIAALARAVPRAGTDGLRELGSQPVFYMSEEGHHSFDKVAHMTGLGRKALRLIPADESLRMDVRALERQILRDLSDGARPFMLVATAGTTNAGSIDPLPELARLARNYGLWYHVDAAWGGGAAFSPKLRRVLAGIGEADSVTCDAHKWLSVPVGAGMFVCRHREVMEEAFRTHTAYAPDQISDGRVYPFVSSMQWSRRFTGLKFFMLLAELGRDGLAARIEHQTAVGEYLRHRLMNLGFKILNPTPLPVVCFTHPRIEAGELTTGDIVAEIRRRGAAWISKTLLRQRMPALRACITHHLTEHRHLDLLVRELDTVVGTLSARNAGRIGASSE